MSFLKRYFIFTMIVCLFLTGCTKHRIPNKNYIENIAPSVLFYIRPTDDDNIEVTTIVPPIKKEERKIIKSEDRTLTGAILKLNANYFREVKTGQLRIVFIDKKIAEQGLFDVINTFFRDPSISQRLYLAVVDGDMESFLNTTLKENIDIFLYEKMNFDESQGEILTQNLHYFLKSYYSAYEDPYLPFYKIQNNKLVYSGIAVFNNDALTDTLTLKEERIFRLLHPLVKYHKVLPVTICDITLLNTKTTTKIDFSNSYNDVNVSVKLSSHLGEYKYAMKSDIQENCLKLEDRIQSSLEQEAKELVNKLQKANSDCLGIGRYTNTLTQKPFTGDTWKDKWSSLEFNIQFEMTFDDLGVSKCTKNK